MQLRDLNQNFKRKKKNLGHLKLTWWQYYCLRLPVAALYRTWLWWKSWPRCFFLLIIPPTSFSTLFQDEVLGFSSLKKVHFCFLVMNLLRRLLLSEIMPSMKYDEKEKCLKLCAFRLCQNCQMHSRIFKLIFPKAFFISCRQAKRWSCSQSPQ